MTEPKPDMSEEEFRERMAAKRAQLADEIAEAQRQIDAKRIEPPKILPFPKEATA